MRYAMLCALVLVASGCATLEKGAGRAVSAYCGAVTDVDQQAVRLKIDAATEPHQVRIHCAHDGE